MENERNQNMPDMRKLREIPAWTRKYAQDKILTNLAILIIFLVLFIGISAPPYLCGVLFKNGNIIAKTICLIVSLSSIICLLYISVPKWGGIKIWRWIDQRIYREGNVSIQEPELIKKKKLGQFVGIVFGGCVACSVILGEKFIPIIYMQPVSAVYVVPFLVFLYLWQRPKYGPLMLIWPVLYAIHAILIVAGAPIAFTNNSGLVLLNMFIPTFGYGLLTFLIIYIYSRYTLKKLKAAAHLPENNNE